jgi:hypothetical protein
MCGDGDEGEGERTTAGPVRSGFRAPGWASRDRCWASSTVRGLDTPLGAVTRLGLYGSLRLRLYGVTVRVGEGGRAEEPVRPVIVGLVVDWVGEGDRSEWIEETDREGGSEELALELGRGAVAGSGGRERPELVRPGEWEKILALLGSLSTSRSQGPAVLALEGRAVGEWGVSRSLCRDDVGETPPSVDGDPTLMSRTGS